MPQAWEGQENCHNYKVCGIEYRPATRRVTETGLAAYDVHVAWQHELGVPRNRCRIAPLMVANGGLTGRYPPLRAISLVNKEAIPNNNKGPKESNTRSIGWFPVQLIISLVHGRPPIFVVISGMEQD